MVDRLGGSGFGRSALEAMLRRRAELGAKAEGGLAGVQVGAGESVKPSFGDNLDVKTGLKVIDSEVKKADELANSLIKGEVQDFHEVAAQIKQSDLSFKFALAVRNKLIESYREVMRMGV